MDSMRGPEAVLSWAGAEDGADPVHGVTPAVDLHSLHLFASRAGDRHTVREERAALGDPSP